MAFRHRIAAGLLAAACALPPTAWGQVSAGASLGGLSYSLFDLDLSDSQLPSLVLSVPDGVASSRPLAAVRVFHAEYGERRYLPVWRDGVAAPGAHYTVYDSDYARSNASLTNRGGDGMGQTLARISRVWEAGDALAEAASTSWSDPVRFTLAPGTRVTFTATLAAWTRVALDATHYGHAEVFGMLSVGNLLDPGQPIAADGRLFTAGSWPDATPSFDERALLSVSYDNPGDQPLYGYAGLHLEGRSFTLPFNVAAVPEPSSMAMLLAGSMLLPLAARRRLPLRGRRPA